MSARKHTRRAGYHSHAALIILLFCVCTVGVLAAYMLIEAGRKSITDQTTTALLQQAQARSSAVASWFGSTESPLTALSRQEALTLFAEEVNNLPAGEAARRSLMPGKKRERMKFPGFAFKFRPCALSWPDRFPRLFRNLTC